MTEYFGDCLSQDIALLTECFHCFATYITDVQFLSTVHAFV